LVVFSIRGGGGNAHFKSKVKGRRNSMEKRGGGRGTITGIVPSCQTKDQKRGTGRAQL